MKKIFLAAFLFLIVFSASTRPTFAAENIFQKTFNSIGNGFQRFYLRWIPGDKPGETVLWQAISSTQQLKTAQVTSEITADLSHDDQAQGNVKINIQGPAQMQPQVGETAKQEMSLSGEFTLQGTTLHIAADTKVAGNTFYFKLNQVPALPNVDLSSITGKWYKTTTTAADGKKAELSAEQKDQLTTAMTQLWKSAKAGAAHAESKNDHDVFVVDVTIPRSALQDYLSTVVEIQSQSNPDQQADITTRIQEQLKKSSDQIGDLKGTLWIDRSTFYVRHVELPITYLIPAQTTPGAEATTFAPLAAMSQVNKVAILVKADLDNFDQPIQFVEPLEALDAKEAFASSFGKMLTPGMTSSEGTSELPTLTPFQKQQLQQLNSISPEQKKKFLDQLNTIEKMKKASPEVTP